MKLQKSGEQFSLYVPNELVEFYDWKKGDFFYPIPTERGVEFVKMESKKKGKRRTELDDFDFDLIEKHDRQRTKRQIPDDEHLPYITVGELNNYVDKKYQDD